MEAVSLYSALLNQQLTNAVFRSDMILFIGKYPFFIPPYLEILEMLEMSGFKDEYAEFLSVAYRRLQPLLMSEKILEESVSGFDFNEIFSLKLLIERFQEVFSKNPLILYKLMRAESIAQRVFLEIQPHCAGLHLGEVAYPVHPFDISIIKKELERSEYVWFANNTRQREILFHADTQIIQLRAVEKSTEYPEPIDKQHESKRTVLAPFFPHTLSLIEQFATDSKSGLGRVALIRLKAGAIAYRHADHEEQLQNRNRYHLVVHAKKGNVLFSGDECVYVEEGQLLKYDNKVMHKSYNQSGDWRVHVVFEMYPVVDGRSM